MRFAASILAALFIALILLLTFKALAEFGATLNPPECHRPCCFRPPPIKAATPRPTPIHPPMPKD